MNARTILIDIARLSRGAIKRTEKGRFAKMDADRPATVLAAETEEEEFEVTPIGDFKTVPEATTASIYGCR
jgi:hypothetical protein